MESNDLKIGVFLCHCGGNISDIIDLERVKESVDVDVIAEFTNLCSIKGRKIIRDNIIGEDLDRVVIAACSPESHGKTFQEYIQPLNPFLMDMANIREQCSWVHSTCSDEFNQKATDKVITLINASIEKVKKSEAVDPIVVQTPNSAAVVGGGIAGMSAALSLGKQGIKTYLIEQSPSIGGHMAKIGKVFSPVKIAEECGLCLLNPVLNDVVWNDNIEIMTNSKVIKATRRGGSFNLLIENKPRYVDGDKCISCGDCAEVCSQEIPDDWNDGLTYRKAIYKPFSQCYPDSYVIDMDNCDKCGDCKRECSMNAISLRGEKEIVPLEVGSVILATGHELFDPNLRPDYAYFRYDDVITQSELGRILGVNGPTKGKFQCLSDGHIPKTVVMIQCVGSRDEKPNSVKYCCKVGCMVALKNANIIKHKHPDTDIYICYTDMRTPGMFEKYYKHVQANGVRLIRGRPGEIGKRDGHLVVRVEDTVNREFREIDTDMVVLTTGLKPSKGTEEVAKIFDVSVTEDGFIKEANPKIKPVTTDVQGAFVAGTAQDPKDITESILQATAAASKVSEIVNNGIEVEPFIADIDYEICDLCMDCIEVCKYKSISVYNEKLYIDPMSCSGCGNCIAKCDKDAISINGNIDEMIFATIDGMLKNKKPGEKRILAFLDDIGYTSADNIGINRLSYPESIHIIKVISVNRVMPKHIIYALKNGADGIFIGEYPGDLMFDEINHNIQKIKNEIKLNNMNPERLGFSKVYIPYFSGLARKFREFDEKIEELNQLAE